MDDNVYSIEVFSMKSPNYTKKINHFKRISTGDLIESNGMASYGESIISKEHWAQLEADEEVVIKLKIKQDRRVKDESRRSNSK